MKSDFMATTIAKDTGSMSWLTVNLPLEASIVSSAATDEVFYRHFSIAFWKQV
jgi:hypothetical protein